jgi:transcriptional regulator
VNYMSSHAEYSLHYQATPTHISTQRKPYHSFVALWVVLDYVVRRYIEYSETARRESLSKQVEDALDGGTETTP